MDRIRKSQNRVGIAEELATNWIISIRLRHVQKEEEREAFNKFTPEGKLRLKLKWFEEDHKMFEKAVEGMTTEQIEDEKQILNRTGGI